MAVVIKHINNWYNMVEISMKSQPYKPHIIHHITHRNTRRNKLSLMMKNQNPGWDFHIPPDRRMAKPNLFLAIHPRACIFQA